MTVNPTIIKWEMDEVHLKIDSKGRLYIPVDIRDQIGDTVTLKKTSEGFLIVPSKPKNFMEEFRKVITSEPPRTGRPENWPPSKMKALWSKFQK